MNALKPPPPSAAVARLTRRDFMPSALAGDADRNARAARTLTSHDSAFTNA